jgi:hypothetical protein
MIGLLVNLAVILGGLSTTGLLILALLDRFKK